MHGKRCRVAFECSYHGNDICESVTSAHWTHCMHLCACASSTCELQPQILWRNDERQLTASNNNTPLVCSRIVCCSQWRRCVVQSGTRIVHLRLFQVNCLPRSHSNSHIGIICTLHVGYFSLLCSLQVENHRRRISLVQLFSECFKFK